MTNGAPNGPRYDWASVDKLLKQRWPYLGQSPAPEHSRAGNAYGALSLSELLGMDRGYVATSRGRGTMTSATADRIAIALGVHPALIWPNWFADAQDEPRCGFCGELLPLGTARKTCSEEHHLEVQKLRARARAAAVKRAAESNVCSTRMGTESDPRTAQTAGGLASPSLEGTDMTDHTDDVSGEVNPRLEAARGLIDYALQGALDQSLAIEGSMGLLAHAEGFLDGTGEF